MATHRDTRETASAAAKENRHRNAGSMHTKLAGIAIGVPVAKRASITQAQADSAVKRYLSGAIKK